MGLLKVSTQSALPPYLAGCWRAWSSGSPLILFYAVRSGGHEEQAPFEATKTGWEKTIRMDSGFFGGKASTSSEGSALMQRFTDKGPFQASCQFLLLTDHRVIIIYCAVMDDLNLHTKRWTRKTGSLMKTKQQVVSEYRRRAIVHAARTVFARKGFSRGIMDEIAKEAGIAKGTVYLYFRSKREIYRAVLDQDMEFLSKVTLERIDAARNLKDKIRAFTLARLENAEAKKDFFRIMDTESGSLSFTRSQYRDWLREPVLRVASAIENASRRGEIRRVPSERVAWIIADMTRGTIQRRLLRQSNTLPSEDSEFLLSFIWAALAIRLDAPKS